MIGENHHLQKHNSLKLAKSHWLCRKFPDNKAIFSCSDEQKSENLTHYGNFVPIRLIVILNIFLIVVKILPERK